MLGRQTEKCRTYMIFIENSEHKRRKFGWVSVRKELSVDFDKALFSQQTIGTVFKETFVPLAYLLFRNCKKN